MTHIIQIIPHGFIGVPGVQVLLGLDNKGDLWTAQVLEESPTEVVWRKLKSYFKP